MERFFIDTESGSTRGRTSYWIVPSTSTLSNSLPAAYRHTTSQNVHDNGRSGGPSGLKAVTNILAISGCHVLFGGAGEPSVSSSNGYKRDGAESNSFNAQLQIRPAATLRRRRSDGVRLSIAMAAHNERHTIAAAIEQVLSVEVPCEIELIVIDDGSTDGTLDIIHTFDDPRLTVLVHPACRGKGASILNAASVATGSHLLVFDADLEYSAADIPSLVEPVLNKAGSVVYGTRLHGSRGLFNTLLYGFGSKITTVITNVIFRSRLRDMHTCLKLIPLPLFRQLKLSNSGFGLDTEISCELLRRRIQPYEVSCSYRARSVAQGKQISFQDGFECLKIIFQVRLRRQILRTELPEAVTVLLSPSAVE